MKNALGQCGSHWGFLTKLPAVAALVPLRDAILVPHHAPMSSHRSSWPCDSLQRGLSGSPCIPEGMSKEKWPWNRFLSSALSLGFVRNEEQISCNYRSCAYSLLPCYLTESDLYCSHRMGLMACQGNLVGEGGVCIALSGRQYMFQLALLKSHISAYGVATV